MKRLAAWLGGAVGVLLVLLLVYGVFIESRLVLDVRRQEVALPGAGSEWDGAEIAVFSDLQMGMWLANPGMIRRIVDEAVEQRPDAVLLGGDFVYRGVADLQVSVAAVMDLLEPLFASGIPTYAVLGNHDYAAGAAMQLIDAFEERGVPVLINESATLAAPDGDADLYIVGVGAHRPGRSRPLEALDDVPDGAPRVVLMHNPASFPPLPADAAPLAVAGHTHCGQIALPGTPFWSWLALRADEQVAVDGWAAPDYGAPGNRLFVTCGIGFSIVPMRISAPPQLAVFALRSSPRPSAPGAAPSNR